MVDNAKLLFHRTSSLWENAEHIRELTSNFMVKYNPAYENPSYVATATPIHQMLLPMPGNNWNEESERALAPNPLTLPSSSSPLDTIDSLAPLLPSFSNYVGPHYSGVSPRSSVASHSSGHRDSLILEIEDGRKASIETKKDFIEVSSISYGEEAGSTNAKFDSGYGSMPDAITEGHQQDEDKMSIRSILTNASRVRLPPQEEQYLISSFAGDLCQDIGFQGDLDMHDRISTRLPDLLKAFTWRLGEEVSSKTERDAKEFVRQQR